MIDVDNLFNLFPDEDNSEGKITAYIDLKNTPLYWLGMGKKLVLNNINFKKKSLQFFKDLETELDVEDIKTAGEFVTYNRSWYYFNKIDLDDQTHLEVIEDYGDGTLKTSLELAIQYFQKFEEYEKCAHLLKIQKKIKL